MDNPLIKILKGMSPTINASNKTFERFANLAAFVPGFATIDGKDIKQVLKTKSFASLCDDGIERIQYNDSILNDNPNISKEEIVALFGKDYQVDIIQHYQRILSTIYAILSSIKDLIPSKTNDSKDAMVVNEFIRFEQFMNKQFLLLSNILSSLSLVIDKLETTKETNPSLVFQEYKVLLFTCIDNSTSLSDYLLANIYFHQIVYEYFYGDAKKKKEYIDQITQIVAGVTGFLSPQLNNINRNMEQAAKNTEQIKEGTEQTLKKAQESIELEKTIISNQVVDKEENSREHANIQEEMNKKQRLERTKPLKLTTCLEAIREVYDDPIYGYYSEFDLHVFAIRNMLSNWNQYLNTDGKKGKPPLPKFDFYRHTDKDTFKKWVREVFFPDYRNRAHKDALDNASHPDMNNMGGVSSEEDIYDEVDQSLANDSNNATENAPNNTTKNEQSDSPSNGHK